MSCTNLSDSEVLKIVQPLVEPALIGAANREYSSHTSGFSVNLKSRITPEVFLAGCDQREAEWGQAAERSLLCILRKEKSFTVIWSQPHLKTTDEIGLLVTVALKGGRYFVDDFRLF